MTVQPWALAAAAEALVGARFRLHGRDPATGLDCIGVLAAALRACGLPGALPTGYGLRTLRLEQWLPQPGSLGFTTAMQPFLSGDVVMQHLGPAQYHLAIADSAGGWIHAHAGLRRVVQAPELPSGAIVHHWRLAPQN